MSEFYRDEHHVMLTTERPDRYVVTTHVGRLVGTVYWTTRGWRCWRNGDVELVANLRSVLAYYRDAS